MLIHHPQGNYAFLKGIAAYSSGVIAADGYALVHAALRAPLPVRDGFAAIARHLNDAGRPMHSLCAIELRSPRPFTFDGFGAFNHGPYRECLDAYGLFLGADNPLARTNVAPEFDPPAEPSLFAFTYTVPARAAGGARDFVVAGAGELVEDDPNPRLVVRPGETNADAMRAKAAYVLGRMTHRMAGLGAQWAQVKTVNIYTIHDIAPFLRDTIIPAAGPAQAHGLCWHLTRPPIDALDFEMDVRNVSTHVSL